MLFLDKSLGIESSVDFYVNAEQADKINGSNTLNFMWENPGRPAVETDRVKVVVFDPEVKKINGHWEKANRFLVDYRTPHSELPWNGQGKLVGGYRKVNYRGNPAMEFSFGYGYTDYVVDGNPSDYEPDDTTKGVLDLRFPVVSADEPIEGLTAVSNGPTLLGSPTTLSAATSAGSNVTYTWAFGDGDTGSGATVTHIYPAADVYTATVIASNSANLLVTTVDVNIIYLHSYAYLPLVLLEWP